MVCKDCRDPIKWLNSLAKHYQPIYGFENEYRDKGKIKQERIDGFNRILYNVYSVTGNPAGKTMLDIGSNLGWFCFEWDQRGGDSTGIEMYPKRVEVCEEIKKMLDLATIPRFINANAVEWVLDSDEQFDYVLLLNAFHHILRADEEGGWNMFNKLINDGSKVFMMVRSSLKGWKLKYPRDIPKSILEQSDANHYDMLERVHGRVIYVFSKKPEEIKEILTISTKR